VKTDFSYDIRVRYSEIDGQKIVFNGNYVNYIDIGITEYYRKIFGDEWVTNPAALHFDPVVAKLTIEYKKPAKLDYILSIFVKVIEIGTSSLKHEIIIKHDDEMVVLANSIQVNCDLESGKAVPIPEKVKELINIFEQKTT
jgi:acyl-CoA thioester hydrolase